MKKIFVILFAIAMFFNVNNASKATTLTFDAISGVTGGTWLSNYGGFNWSNMGVVSGPYYAGLYVGVANLAAADGHTNVAVNWYYTYGPATISSPDNFTFNSADFGATISSWSTLHNNNIEVQGFENGILVPGDDKIFAANDQTPTLVTFNWQNINELAIDTSPNGNQFTMDNFTYNEPVNPSPTPEPSSMLLGLMSLGGLWIKRRK